MEKRTCKSYEINDVENIKIKVGTTEKNETRVIYATGKTKIKYTGEDESLTTYNRCMNEFSKFVENEIKTNPNLQKAFIGAPLISEYNLKIKKYTKLEYELFIKLVKPNAIDKIFPEIRPFFVKIYETLKETLNKHKFII